MILNHISVEVIYGDNTPTTYRTSFVNTQDVWHIHHGLGQRHGVIVNCIDPTNTVLQEGDDYEVYFLDPNSLEIRFAIPMAGMCICTCFEGNQSIDTIKACSINEAIDQLTDALEIEDLKRLYKQMDKYKSKIEEKILLES